MARRRTGSPKHHRQHLQEDLTKELGHDNWKSDFTLMQIPDGTTTTTPDPDQ